MATQAWSPAPGAYTVETLPADVLDRIVDFLDITSLCRLLQVSRTFAAYGRDEQLWRRRCRAEYPPDITDLQEWTDLRSYRELYVILACTFYLRGVWTSPSVGNGSVLYICVWPNVVVTYRVVALTLALLAGQPDLDSDERRAIGVFYRPQPHPSVSFTKLTRFATVMSGQGIGSDERPAPSGGPGGTVQISTTRLNDDNFNYELSGLPGYYPVRHYRRISDSVLHPPPATLQGLWQGEYGPHGREIIQVLPPDDQYYIKGLKLTGDPNVPAGQVSFRVPHQQPAEAVDGQGPVLRYRGEGLVADVGFQNGTYVSGDLFHAPGNFSTFVFRWRDAFAIRFERLRIYEHPRVRSSDYRFPLSMADPPDG